MAKEPAKLDIQPVAKAGADKLLFSPARADIEVEFCRQFPVKNGVSVTEEQVNLADCLALPADRKIARNHLNGLQLRQPVADQRFEIPAEIEGGGISDRRKKRCGIRLQSLEKSCRLPAIGKPRQAVASEQHRRGDRPRAIPKREGKTRALQSRSPQDFAGSPVQ